MTLRGVGGSFTRLDRSLQTAARAKHARPECRHRKRRLGRVLLGLALALVALAGPSSASRAPHVGPEAAEDIRLLVRELEARHPNPYHDVPRADFHRAVEDLISRLPSLDENQLLVELMRLTVLGPRDGHTGIPPGLHSRTLHRYPLRLYYFADGVHVVRALGVPGAVGARLLAINGIPVAEVEARVLPLIPRDNDRGRLTMLPGYLMTAEVLHGLRVVPGTSSTTFTLQLRSGERRDVSLGTVTADQYDRALGQFWQLPVRSGIPRKRLSASLRWPDRPRYITTIDRGRAVYFAYNNTLQSTDDIADRLRSLVRDRKVRRVIVDVRRNGGGNNRTLTPLLYFLQSRSVNRPGKLVVITGRLTFSAAQNFVTRLDLSTRAVFVGEPTGGSPNHYSGGGHLDLPNLGLHVGLAIGYLEDSRPDDPRLAVEPEVPVAYSSADFMAGRDPVLAAALRLRR